MSFHVKKETYQKLKAINKTLEKHAQDQKSRIEYLERALEDGKKQRQNLQSQIDEVHIQLRADQEKMDIFRYELQQIAGGMGEHGLQPLPGDRDHVISIERKFGRAEAEIRALLQNNQNYNTASMPMSMCASTDRARRRYQ